MTHFVSDPIAQRRIYGVGVIGAGGIFAEHARGYAQLAGVRVVGLADVDAERMRRASRDFFIPYTTSDYRQLLTRDDIDIIDICTPPVMHEEMICAALAANKYVLCEKPMAPSLAAADRIIAVADRHPDKLSIIYQLRNSPEVNRILWLRDQGLLGELQFGRFSRYGSLPAEVSKAWWGCWEIAGGGALMTQCIHEIDLILHIFGPVARATASMATCGNQIESEDTFAAILEMQSGAIVSCYCSLSGQADYSVNWDVIGASASAHLPWSIQSKDAQLRRAALRETVRRFPSSDKRNLLPGRPGKIIAKIAQKLGFGKRSEPSRHKAYFTECLRAIESGSQMPVPPAEARRSLEVCTAIYTSAITHEPVVLPLHVQSRFYNGITTNHYDGRVSPA